MVAGSAVEPWSKPQPKRLPVAAVIVAIAVGYGLLMAYLFWPTPTATAVVVGPAGAGQTELRVVGAAETSVVDWPELIGAPRGATLTVGLDGACECEPVRPRRVTPPLLVTVGALPAVLLFMAVRVVREDKYGRYQRRAALADPSVARPVSVRAHFTPLTRKAVGSWLQITDRMTGAPLGWLQVAQLTPHFSPSRLAWMIGADDPTGCVALQDDTRVHTVVPIGPLSPTAPPPTDWSEAAVHLLGWDRGAAAGPPEPAHRLPADGRVSVSAGGTAPALWVVARRARERSERLFPPLGVLLVVVGGLVLSLLLTSVAGVLAVVPTFGVLFAILLARAAVARPVRKALEAQVPQLAPHAAVLAAVLITLVPPADPSEVAVVGLPAGQAGGTRAFDRPGQTAF